MTTVHDAYRQAIAADEAYSVECRRAYGNNAALRRYLAHDTSDTKLIAAMEAKLAADRAYFECCRTTTEE